MPEDLATPSGRAVDRREQHRRRVLWLCPRPGPAVRRHHQTHGRRRSIEARTVLRSAPSDRGGRHNRPSYSCVQHSTSTYDQPPTRCPDHRRHPGSRERCPLSLQSDFSWCRADSGCPIQQHVWYPETSWVVRSSEHHPAVVIVVQSAIGLWKRCRKKDRPRRG